jgi:pyruvate dehydrogenase E2 component (dihydrolipoamide acetyltransferase)
MLQSKRTKPCFYLKIMVDMTEVLAIRPKLRKTHNLKITTNSFYLYAVAKAAEKYPLIVATIDGDHLVTPPAINAGFAVSAPQGLVVPVIKNANQINIDQVTKEERRLTQLARSNTLKLTDLENQSITVTNLGSYSIDSFVAIVPPTTTAIVSIGQHVHFLRNVNGVLMERHMAKINLAVDHRVANGDYAAQFLKRVKDLLEEPALLYEI